MTGSRRGGEHPPERWRRVLRAVSVDTSAYRASRDYRLLLIGGVISRFGSQMTLVALPVQMYRMTGSPWQVGLLGLAEFVPFAALSLFGGALSDRYDRRRLLICSQAASAVVIGTLAVTTATGTAGPPLLYTLAGGTGAAAAFDGPVRQALMMQVLPGKLLRSGVSLWYGVAQVTVVVGPALGGFLVAWWGPALVYTVDAVTFTGLIATVLMIRHRPAVPERAERPPVLRSIGESLAFAWRERAVLGSFGIDLIAMTFGMPRALFPVLALHTYQVGAQGTGLLFSAVSLGALVAALTSGWLKRVRRLGRVVVWAVLCWGGAIALAGTMPAFAGVLVCFVVAGAADSVSAVCRSTIVQTITTEEMRGRMSALYIMVVGSGPYLGDAQAGAMGSLLSPRVAVFSGGVLSLLGAVLVAVLCPGLYRFDSDDYPEPGRGPSRPAGDEPADAAHGRKGTADPVEVTD